MNVLGLPLALLVWGLAVGVLMWGSGLDMLIQLFLHAHYHQEFNSLVRFMGELGLGRTLIWVGILGGLGVAVWHQNGNLSGRLAKVPRWLAGCFVQLADWVRGKKGWTRLWKDMSPVARSLMLVAPLLAVTGTIQVIVKAMVGRPRPKEVLWNGWSPYELHAVWSRGAYDAGFLSFPSGHSCSTWAVAVLFMHIWPKRRGVIALLAVLASASRFLAVTPHYLGDVAAGAGLGAAVGLVVCRVMQIGYGRKPVTWNCPIRNGAGCGPCWRRWCAGGFTWPGPTVTACLTWMRRFLPRRPARCWPMPAASPFLVRN